MITKMRGRLVRNLLDMLILKQLRNRTMSAYDIIAYAEETLHVSVSPGKVYYTLLLMERSGLIEGRQTPRKRVYTLTDEGRKTLEKILGENGPIKGFMTKLMGEGEKTEEPKPSPLIGKEAIIMTNASFAELQKRLEEIFSPTAASVILYEGGKACGEKATQRLLNQNFTSGGGGESGGPAKRNRKDEGSRGLGNIHV